eukprot:CAMPEP_0115041492 /NCGR_PEP_ID=MMETSP0216-20121206/45553_1 /TAXON_ID=223996 /ORGANISM="Protocruzia adherens, Strain Boccale" /LENGTH=918 /DNA_ID=CAMNT_0002423127 /DNA_START=224 /DNA_END=2980 /DNA_ORIENTATION=-
MAQPRSKSSMDQKHPQSSRVATEGSPGKFTINDSLNTAIHEYLLKNGYFKTLDAFQKESVKEGDVSNIRELRKDQDYVGLSHLIQCFDMGDRERFFVGWRRYLPITVRSKETVTSKIEFYLQVYFSIYALTPSNKLPPSRDPQRVFQEEMAHFKNYLDSKGSELASSAEFLAFYALPYIPNPVEHPSFKHLFSKEWSRELRSKLKTFLGQNLQPMSNPILMQVYQDFLRESGTQSAKGHRDKSRYENQSYDDLKEKYQGLQTQYSATQKRLEHARSDLIESQTKWTNFTRDILNLAKDLLKSIKRARRGYPIQDQTIQLVSEKIHRYGTFLNMNMDDLTMTSHSQYISHASVDVDNNGTTGEVLDASGSYIESITPNAHHRTVSAISVATNVMQSLNNIHYSKIRSTLLSKSVEEVKKHAILQALRWRLSRVRSSLVKKQVLHYYIYYDVLGIASAEEEKSTIEDSHVRGDLSKLKETSLSEDGFKILLEDMSRAGVEYVIRFVNVIASECAGRTYLLKCDRVIHLLVQVLQAEEEDSILRQNALGALQKFSLRRDPQSVMIELDMIKWILETLKREVETLSDYSIEYATALLMNLSLRTAGKDKCQDPSLEVITVLIDLAEHENLQVRTYINGTLYSVLTRGSMKAKAKQMGLEEMLVYLMKNSDEQIRKQIQYILEQLHSDAQDGEESDDNEDDEFDAEDSEEEDDEEEFISEDEDMDDVIEKEGVLTGEELLLKEFSAEADVARSQYDHVSSRIYEERKRTMDTLDASQLDKSSIDRKSDISDVWRRPSTPMTLKKDKSVPSSLRSRPKLPRTPVNRDAQSINAGFAGATGGKHGKTNSSQTYETISSDISALDRSQHRRGGQQSHLQIGEKSRVQKESLEKSGSPNPREDDLSFTSQRKIAFSTRERIPRTPPS